MITVVKFFGLLVFIVFISCESNKSNETDNACPADTVTLKYVDANRWKLFVANNGSWGWNGGPMAVAEHDLDEDGPGGEFPKGSNNFLIYASGFWVGTLINGNPVVSWVDFESEFQPGRITNENPVPISELESSDILSQGVYIFDGDCEVEFGTHRVKRLSDQDSWTVVNDLDSSRHHVGAPPNIALGLEVQRMTYMFTDSLLNDVVFIRFRITNKSDINYSNTYFALWSDPDVGVWNNDRIGTDSIRNMVYCYNFSDEATTTGMQYAVGYQLLYNSKSGGKNATIKTTRGYHENVDPYEDDSRYRHMNGPFFSDEKPLFATGDPVTASGGLDEINGPKRLLACVGPLNLLSGESQDVVFAIIGGEAIDRLGAIVDLRNKADYIKSRFDQSIATILGLP